MALDAVPRRPPGSPAIAFTERRRPEDATQVRLADWEGPLGLLLALVEARRLDVMTVPLGGLAEAYLDAIAGLDDDRLGNLSSFVAVASQLILIKSRALLPRPPGAAIPLDDEPDPEAALRARLLAYRAYRDAADRLQARALAGWLLARREPVRRARRRPAPARSRRSRRAWTPRSSCARWTGWPSSSPPAVPPPESIPRTITLDERADAHPGGARGGRPGRAPGPARRRARPGGDRGDLPGDARARQAPRGRRSSRTSRGVPSSCGRSRGRAMPDGRAATRPARRAP